MGGGICPTTISESCELYRIETINNNTNIGSDKNIMDINSKKYRIRKLTENECWKLMGMTSEDCNKCKDVGMSKTQLYKQAGNGLVTNCVQLLFEHLYKAQYNPDYECIDEKILSENISIENFI